MIPRNEWPRVRVPPIGGWAPTDTLSVIVPAKGSPQNLDRCLTALGEQTYPAGLIEVIVVDDASDPPLEVPDTIGAQIPVRLLRHEPHGTFGAGRARVTGAAASQGDILVFLDADVLVAPTFIEEHARWHHRVSDALVTGVLGFAEFADLSSAALVEVLRGQGLDAYAQSRATEGQIWRDRHFARSHDLTVEAADLFRSTIGAVGSLRREFYEYLGGYRVIGIRGIEDTEFGYRAHVHGALFVLERASRLWHQGRRSYDAGRRAEINATRAPYVEDLMPVAGMRPDPPTRRYRVPSVLIRVVDTPGHPADASAAAATADAVRSSAFTDAVMLAETEGIDPVDLAAAPYVVELQAGLRCDPEALGTVVSMLRTGEIGVLHLIDDRGAPVGVAYAHRAYRRAERHQARPVFTDDADRRAALMRPADPDLLATAGSLFRERWCPASTFGIHTPARPETTDIADTRVTAVADTAPAVTDLDLVYVTDLRFPGGTSSSLVEELRAAARAGYRIGVLHLSSPTVGAGIEINPQVEAVIEDGLAVSLLPGEPVAARLVIIKHPMVANRSLGGRFPIETDQLLVTVGQVPGHADGTVYYRPATVDAELRAAFGMQPQWAPVSPVVRRALQATGDAIELTETDWSEVLDLDAWWSPRPFGADGPLVIGRHGRPDPLKWPATADEVLAAYPADPEVRVRVLGAPETLADLIGEFPANWEVLDFGSEPVPEFLGSLDVFVYQHHPDLVEAFGRTVLEALATGVVAVVPPRFAELFDDGCRYASPEEVRAQLDALRADPEAAREQIERGREIVAQRYSHATHLARLAERIGPPGLEPIRRAPADHQQVLPAQREDRPTVLVSALGAGAGQLDAILRSLDAHRRRHLGFLPIVVTTETIPPLAAERGIETTKITAQRAWEDPREPWTRYAQRRLRQIAAANQVDSITVAEPTDPNAWIALGIRPRATD